MVHHRWVALAMTCCVLMCTRFASEHSVGLQDNILRSLDLSTANIEWYHSMYFWPNIVLSILAGFIIDYRDRVRLAAIAFAVLVVGGQFLLTYGAFSDCFWMMNVGRLIFGIGGESLGIAMNNYAFRWFARSGLSLAVGTQVAAARLGSVFSVSFSQDIYKFFKYGPSIQWSSVKRNPVGSSLLLSSLICGIGLIFTFFLGCYDRRYSREFLSPMSSPTSSPRTSSTISPRTSTFTLPAMEVVAEEIRLKDIKHFRLSFWFLAVICKSYSIAFFSFASLGIIFLKTKYSMLIGNANHAIALLFSIPIIGCPLFGYLIDRSGRNLVWILVSVIILLCSHLILFFSPSCQPELRSSVTFDIIREWYDAHFLTPWIVVTLMGLSYSIFSSAFWPTIAFIVPAHHYSTAQGVTQSIQNFGLAWSPFIVGFLVLNNGFSGSEVFLINTVNFALSLLFVLFVVDMTDGSPLNQQGSFRKEVRLPIYRHPSVINEEAPLLGSSNSSGYVENVTIEETGN